ncbi:Metallo-dependent phosphatase [Violaceomyces palustris]|uniref:Metallo-dependent phosphatase n=1 Tax=Violaceomyces palustris TaxID=1673888 RepID=A0ACD0NXP5_9BASI|nr:Metallo-dependent phosphatase [Violaceomyces palustris]
MLVLVIGDLHIPYRSHDLPAKFKKLLVPGKIQQIICTGNVCNTDYLHYLRTIAGDVHVVKGDYDDNPHFPSSLILNHPPLRIGVLHGHQVVPAGETESLSAIARAMDTDILLTGHTHRFEAFELDGRFFVNPGSATGAWHPVWPVKTEAEGEDGGEGVAKEGQEAGSEEKGKEETKRTKAGGTEGETKKDKKENDSGKAAQKEKEKNKANKDDKDGKSKEGKEQGQVEGEESDEDQPEPKEAPGPIPSFALLDIQGAVVVTYVYQLIEGEVKVEKIEYRKQVESGNMALRGGGGVGVQAFQGQQHQQQAMSRGGGNGVGGMRY